MTQAYDADLLVFHNPHCSKSREALALLLQRGLNPEVIESLKTPPSLAQLQALQRLLGLPARELLRSGEEAYRELGLADASLSDERLLQAIAEHPVLLQRPIVVHKGRALIARPPELALQVLASR
jgi:arsenate reductase